MILSRAFRMTAGSNAGHRAVAIARATLVLRIRLRLAVEWLRVTVDAGHVRVICRVNVAIRTNCIVVRQSPVHRVIKCGVQPTGRVVASRAGGWEARCNVIRHISTKRRCALPSSRVAAVAIGRQISGIVVIHVARRTGRLCWIRMCSGQGKSSGAVIELAGGPCRNRMARRTHGSGVGKTGRNMIWNRTAECSRAIPCCSMATHAVCRVQRIVIVDMAGSAGSRCRGHVRPNERESCHAVIKRSGIPACGGMAIRTISHRKCGTGRRVHGVICLLPSRQMALRISAIGRRNVQ